MISVTSKYAIRAMLEIARLDGAAFVTVDQLSTQHNVPKPYLSKLIKGLVKSGLLEGRKGPGGGVRISNRGRNASFYDICVATNDPITRSRCLLSRSACRVKSPCRFHHRWKEISGAAGAFLKAARVGSPPAPKR